ncbi:MAG: hypothetical protein ACI4I6_09450 [Hominimerdicola sp.]
MTIIIDDINIKSPEDFYPFISKSLGIDYDRITDENSLYDVVSEMKSDEPLEIIMNDFDELEGEELKFARKVLSVFMDARFVNKNLQVSFVDDKEIEPYLEKENV